MKMIELREVFENLVRTQIIKPDGSVQIQMKKVYNVRECLINPSYIVAVYPHRFTTSVDREMISEIQDSDTDLSYSRIILDGNSFRKSEIIVDMSYENLVRRLK